jgi:hypothetical protein
MPERAGTELVLLLSAFFFCPKPKPKSNTCVKRRNVFNPAHVQKNCPAVTGLLWDIEKRGQGSPGTYFVMFFDGVDAIHFQEMGIASNAITIGTSFNENAG